MQTLLYEVVGRIPEIGRFVKSARPRRRSGARREGSDRFWETRCAILAPYEPLTEWGSAFFVQGACLAKTSRISGFYRLSPEERVRLVTDWAGLSAEEQLLLHEGGLDCGLADRMVENVVGTHALPLGIATNFSVNGRDYLVPMAIEEPSVVAGASFAARLARAGGGFTAHSTPSHMIAQVQVLDVVDPWAARFRLLSARERLFSQADQVDRVIVGLGGGMRELEVDVLADTPAATMLEVRLIYDCLDAMGANTLNTIAEALAPSIAEIAGGRVNLRIISNLADRRLGRAQCVVPASALALDAYPGEVVVDRIVEAYAFAACSPYRAATHNKGIMNGVDAVVVATGNDWRAIEAGAHAYAARTGRYTSLSRWEKDARGDLVGSLEMPMAIGLVGGATRVHPTAKLAVKILGVESARELSDVIVSVGLAQNLAALRALATEGIQRGHMALHARQVAIAAGAVGGEVDEVVGRMVAEQAIRVDRAEAILRELR
ncbi:MAG: hydroxymethylglutaryl-CoA reductase, degradative [Anaerolineae bacterium]|nr:hydroxymethylglutaryl-CoA reductase, degradative [Anaerolineae bacterium]